MTRRKGGRNDNLLDIRHRFCTLTLVLFMSFDVLRNRGVVDKTREDIEMIKKRINESVKDMKHPVAYTVENYVIIPKTHLDEYNNTCTRVEIQARGIQFSGNGKDFEEVPSITHVKVGEEIISRKEEKYY